MSSHPNALLKNERKTFSNSRFASIECLTIAENMFSYQSNEGGWPKNTDTVSIRIVRSNSGIGVQRWKPIPR